MEKPPHLKAIAPWEGATDFRRHVLERGGIGNFPFINFLFGRFAGNYNSKSCAAVMN